MINPDQMYIVRQVQPTTYAQKRERVRWNGNAHISARRRGAPGLRGGYGASACATRLLARESVEPDEASLHLSLASSATLFTGSL
jgi:hypothetical protein